MSIAAVILRYEEPGWTDETIRCARAAGIQKIVFADREGVGCMSTAFNEAIFTTTGTIRSALVDFKYIWWLTNVTFDIDVPGTIAQAFEDDIACVHPCHASDHLHLQNTRHAAMVPFIELTAPMFSTRLLRQVGQMDEAMWGWGMDLDWSYRAKQLGYGLMVSPARVDHVYLRHIQGKHPVSVERERLRTLHSPATTQALADKWGPDWQKKLWP